MPCLYDANAPHQQETGHALSPTKRATNTTGSNSTQSVTLSSTHSPLLYQNIPNPFSTGTKVNYFLPEGTTGATLMFYDSYGNQIKTIGLYQTGNGTINVTPDNLTAGIYSYSLVMDNKVIDTKKMLIQK